MPAKKNPTQAAFTSFRVIGKKAQRLIQAARDTAKDKKNAKKNIEESAPSAQQERIVLDISTSSVAKAACAVLGIIYAAEFLGHISHPILLIVLGVFVAAVIDPGVHALEQRGFPRGIAILIHYFLVLFLVTFLLFSLIPIIAAQLQQIALFISSEVDAFLANPQIDIPFLRDEVNERLTRFIQSTLQSASIYDFAGAMQSFGQNLSSAAQGSFRVASQIFGSAVRFVVSMIVVLVFGFFVQLEKENIVMWLRSFFPSRARHYIDHKSEAMHTKIGQWARGQLLLCCSIFALTFLALVILRMPYALTLAVFAGFCEFIPVIGPLIAATPAVLIGLTQEGFFMAVVLAVIYYLIQWSENNLLVPLIMRRAVGLSPIAILFAMMVGASFSETIPPILGIILAIPTTTILTIFLEDWRRGKKK